MANKKKKGLTSLEKYVIDKISVPQYFNDYLYNTKPGLTKLTDSCDCSSICPFHDDVNPSFRFWKSKKFFICFGCSISGDVINLHRKALQHKSHKAISRAEALKDLCRLYNIPIKLEKTAVKSELVLDVPDKKLEEKPLNAFQQARKSLDMQSAVVEHRKHFTLDKFIATNQRILHNPNISEDIRIAEYAELDLRACIACSLVEEQVKSAQQLSDKELEGYL